MQSSMTSSPGSVRSRCESLQETPSESDETMRERHLTAIPPLLLLFARQENGECDIGAKKSRSTSPATGWFLTSFIPTFNHRERARTDAPTFYTLDDWSTRRRGHAVHTACNKTKNDPHNLERKWLEPPWPRTRATQQNTRT